MGLPPRASVLQAASSLFAACISDRPRGPGPRPIDTLDWACISRRMGTHGNKGRERLTKRERQALKDEGGVIDRGNTAAAGTRLAFRKSSCGVNTGPRRRKLDTRRPAKTFELLLNCSRRPLRRPRSDRHLMGARLLMRVAAVALLHVAAAAPLPTTWPPPHKVPPGVGPRAMHRVRLDVPDAR